MKFNPLSLGALVSVAFGIACSSSNPAPGTPAAKTDAGNPALPDASVSDDDAATTDDDAGTADEPVPTPQCDEYCAAVMTNCTGVMGADGSSAAYASTDGCMAECAQINSGDYMDSDGVDSLGCRLAHAKLAQSAPAKHCAAAGASGGGICDDLSTYAGPDSRCADFCTQTLALCNTDMGVTAPPYPDYPSCLMACGNSFHFDATQRELTPSGNTLNCRQYHVNLAYDGAVDGGSGASFHCPTLAFPASQFCL